MLLFNGLIIFYLLLHPQKKQLHKGCNNIIKTLSFIKKMKLSNEVKIGLFATITIVVAIIGYRFLKGQNLFSKAVTLNAEYADAQQINKSSPVYFHGVEVGNVLDFYFKPDDVSKVTLTLNIKNNPGIPKNARAVIFSNGLLGGKAINLEFDAPCTGGDCAQSGDYIKGMTRGALEGMIGTPADMDPYIDKASKGIYTLMDTLKMSLQDPNNEVGKSLRDIQMTLLSLRQTTAVLNQVMAASAGSLNGTMKNVESITSNLKTNNEKITTMLSNINDVTGKANTIDFSKINKATEGVGQSIDELKKTLAETQSSLNQLTSTFKSVNAGEGTLGQLAKNDSVYHSLNRTLIQTQALMQDVRLNPKRYINLNPFRKYKQYVVPSKDPLLDTMQMRYNSLQKKN